RARPMGVGRVELDGVEPTVRAEPRREPKPAVAKVRADLEDATASGAGDQGAEDGARAATDGGLPLGAHFALDAFHHLGVRQRLHALEILRSVLWEERLVEAH